MEIIDGLNAICDLKGMRWVWANTAELTCAHEGGPSEVDTLEEPCRRRGSCCLSPRTAGPAFRVHTVTSECPK